MHKSVSHFTIQNGPKQALLLLLFNFTLHNAVRRVKEKQEGLKLNGTHHFVGYAYDVNILGENIDTIQKNTELY
jgi:hypothetical protein